MIDFIIPTIAGVAVVLIIWLGKRKRRLTLKPPECYKTLRSYKMVKDNDCENCRYYYRCLQDMYKKDSK